MPLLKKSSLDQDTMKNYRPVSILPFVSKVVDRVVASQLNAHMLELSLLEPAQSAKGGITAWSLPLLRGAQ